MVALAQEAEDREVQGRHHLSLVAPLHLLLHLQVLFLLGAEVEVLAVLLMEVVMAQVAVALQPMDLLEPVILRQQLHHKVITEGLRQQRLLIMAEAVVAGQPLPVRQEQIHPVELVVQGHLIA